ncbi:MAG: hypothetical protein ACR2G0_05930, partial [Chthoniobacterales bacterium]
LSHERNGAIQLGADADLVVYDPNYRGEISAQTHQINLDYLSFEGMEIESRPHVATVRGQVAVRDRESVGEVGRGKFLDREPNHFQIALGRTGSAASAPGVLPEPVFVRPCPSLAQD